jgi:allophanate hydrolase subunit 2
LASCQTFTVKAHQTLRIGGAASGCRAYLCVPGGFQAKLVLGSVTAFEPIKEGESLTCDPSMLPGRSLDWPRPTENSPRMLRVLPGPQADWFDASFLTRTYRVTPANNRMGIRLDGPPLDLPKRELVSESVAPGAVQITYDGKPIVLGVDGQTIGGYPKVAHVICADLDELGQLRPGDHVRFRKVGEKEAEKASAEHRVRLRKAIRRMAIALS